MHADPEGIRLNWHTDGRLVNPAYDTMVRCNELMSVIIPAEVPPSESSVKRKPVRLSTFP